MKIRAADLKAGDQVWTDDGALITLDHVQVFKEQRSGLAQPGRPMPYLPGCVFVTWGEKHHTFLPDDMVDKRVPLVGFDK